MRSTALFLCLALCPLPALSGQPAAVKHPGYETREIHDPNGIGKFYLGREIAQVMGHQGASWLERPEREKEEAPTKLIQALQFKPGMVVADIGAGSGYHTFRIAPLVGPKGKVYAVDIQDEMLAMIRKKMKDTDTDNVVPVKGKIDDPNLPAGSVDLAFMVDVYHEFSHPFEMTSKLVEALKPGGKLVFVEFRLEDPKVPIKLVHKMTQKQVIREMEIYPNMRYADDHQPAVAACDHFREEGAVTASGHQISAGMTVFGCVILDGDRSFDFKEDIQVDMLFVFLAFIGGYQALDDSLRDHAFGELIYGKKEKAIKLFEASLALHNSRLVVDPDGQRLTYGGLGSVYSGLDDLLKAEAYFEKALWVSESPASPSLGLVAESKLNLSQYYLINGKHEKAQTLLLDSLNYYLKVNDKRPIRTCYFNLGRLAMAKGNLADAEKFLLLALEEIRKDKERPETEEISYLGDLAILYCLKGDLKSALSFLESGKKIIDDVRHIKTLLNYEYATYHFALSDLNQAELKLLELNKNTKYREQLGKSHELLGDIHVAKKNTAKALEHYEQSLSLRRQIFSPDHYLIARTLEKGRKIAADFGGK